MPQPFFNRAFFRKIFVCFKCSREVIIEFRQIFYLGLIEMQCKCNQICGIGKIFFVAIFSFLSRRANNYFRAFLKIWRLKKCKFYSKLFPFKRNQAHLASSSSFLMPSPLTHTIRNFLRLFPNYLPNRSKNCFCPLDSSKHSIWLRTRQQVWVRGMLLPSILNIRSQTRQLPA